MGSSKRGLSDHGVPSDRRTAEDGYDSVDRPQRVQPGRHRADCGASAGAAQGAGGAREQESDRHADPV